MKKYLFLITISFIFFFFAKISLASTFYVDGQLSTNCTGNYSIANRSCTGLDGNAYKTVAGGVAAAVAGDTINIRQGTYNEYNISITFNSSMTTIQAYNKENVTLIKTSNDPMRFPVFSLGNANNVTFKDLKFVGTKYKVIPGWIIESGNIWKTPFDYEPTQIRFDTMNGGQKNTLAELTADKNWFWDRSQKILYIYSLSDPSSYTNPGINVADNYDGVAIGDPSGYPNNLIIVNNCDIRSFPHVGVKGGFKYWIKYSYFDDIGTDFNDHHLYLVGTHSAGNEAIVENNYFGYTPGAAVHLYSDPSYHIVRNNIFNAKKSDGTRSFWAILLSGSNHKIYNNTIYGAFYGIMPFRAECHDNEMKNNIFYDNTYDIGIDHAGDSNLFPMKIVAQNNYYGSQKTCVDCTDHTSLGGDNYSLIVAPPNIIDIQNPFSNSSFQTWADFHLNYNSPAINTALNLGDSNKMAFDPSGNSWPLSTLDQNTQGVGWEIGAFAYREAIIDTTPPQAPAGVTVS